MRRILLATFLVSLAAVAADRRPIAATDLYSFRWIADPQISPDGSHVAFTFVTVNAKKEGYDTSVWIVSTDGGSPRQITAGPRDSSPRWSPDARRLAFLRAAEKDGKPQPAQIYILPMEGGEARQLTALAKGASSPAWSPDGKTIAFNSTTLPRDDDKKAEDDRSDVRVITRAVYRSNGSGYVDFERPPHIWTVPVPGIIASPEKASQLTTGPYAESSLQWSRDGSRIFFLSNRDLEPYYKPPATELYSIGVRGGTVGSVAKVDGAIRAYALDPSGTRVAFVASLNGSPIRSHSQADLWISPLTGGEPKNLTTGFDNDVLSGVGGDQAPPRGSGSSRPFWSPDGRYLYLSAAEQGRTNLKRIDVETGDTADFTSGDHAVLAWSSTPDASKIALTISTPTRVGDLFLFDGTPRRLSRLTDVNKQLFDELNLTDPEMIWYTSFDGKRIQAWVQRPPDWKPDVKYPLILNIHGGPHSAYGYIFDHEFQWMAAKGYMVLYPNPRGSTSYGQDFANIIQFNYPGDDFKDLMAGVDELVRRGWADPGRLAVTGGSGGGVLTNWTIGHTDRFKAAVSQRSIADWRDFWYTADFALFQPTWFRAAPWEDEAGFKARSPITYVNRVRTPTMFIEGEADLRTPPGAGGEQMFRALKYRRIPTVMVQFPGESHELSRSGRPRHRVERLEHIVAWFDKFVLGLKAGNFDPQ